MQRCHGPLFFLRKFESVNKTIPCRLCQKASRRVCEKTLYWGEKMTMFCCSTCGHLQSSLPTWLDRSYQEKYGEEDIGMADRCLWTAQTTVAFAHLTGIKPSDPCLDWGTGTGLFVRFCRDAGMNFYGYEPLGNPLFCRSFVCGTGLPQQAWTLITAFEVVEHFTDPSVEFEKIFSLKPETFLFTTLLYQGQGPEWWYLVANGQHVSLYTEKGLKIIGQKFGYNLTTDGTEFHLFSKKRYSPKILRAIRKKREVWSAQYRKRHGDRISSDSEIIRKKLSHETTP